MLHKKTSNLKNLDFSQHHRKKLQGRRLDFDCKRRRQARGKCTELCLLLFIICLRRFFHPHNQMMRSREPKRSSQNLCSLRKWACSTCSRTMWVELEWKLIFGLTETSLQVEQISQMAYFAEALLDYHQQCTEILKGLVETMQEK